MEQIISSVPVNLMSYSMSEMIVNASLAVIIGFWLSFIYKHTHKGLSYSQSFSQTVVFITLIVALVMMVIGGSLTRAFALVGAMSIIRFRTVLKDTKDLSYIFSALTLGMAAGTSNYFLAGIGTLFFSALAYVLTFTNFGSVYKSEFILRFRFDQNGDSTSFLNTIKENCKRSNLLHIEPSGDSTSLLQTYDVALRDEVSHSELIAQLDKIPDLSEIVLIASKNDVDY